MIGSGNPIGWKLEKQDGMKSNKRGNNVSKFITKNNVS